jgi:hypothetical protein
MKNITLSIDEDLLRDVRKYAAEHNTTVNALVRARLAELVAPKKRIKDAVKRMRELAKKGGMEVGPITWKRDDLYER